MSGKNKINGFMKHKRIIIIGLLAVGFIFLILLVYILTYVNNKPKPFSGDANVKITNKCDDFTLSVVAESIKLNDKSNGKGNIELRATIRELKSTGVARISDARITFEAHSNWTTKTDISGSSVSFNNGNTLTPGSEWSATSTLNLGINYPVKVMPLVKVKSPIIYAKVNYTRTPNSQSIASTQETVYYKLTYNQYYVDGVTVLK